MQKAWSKVLNFKDHFKVCQKSLFFQEEEKDQWPLYIQESNVYA